MALRLALPDGVLLWCCWDPCAYLSCGGFLARGWLEGPTPRSGGAPSRASSDLVSEATGRGLTIAASREKKTLRVCCPIRRPGASLLGEECALRGLREGFVIVCHARSGAGWDGRGWGGVYLTLTWGWVEEGARAAAEDSQALGPR